MKSLFLRKQGATPKNKVLDFFITYQELDYSLKEIADYSGAGYSTVKLLVKNWLYTKKRYLWDRLVGLKYANSLDVIFVDSPLLKKIYSNFGFKSNKLVVLPEFIDLSTFTAATTQKSFEKVPGRFDLLYAGRLVGDKGPDLLLEAVKGIAKQKNIRTFHIR